MSADGSAAVADMFISMAVIFVHLMQPDTSLDVSEECRVPCKIFYKFYKDIEEKDICLFCGESYFLQLAGTTSPSVRSCKRLRCEQAHWHWAPS